jgi:hypothetical protein
VATSLGNRSLFVASGGGGDAIAAAMVASALGEPHPLVASFAWERKRYDPRPGPRTPADFAGLRRVGPHSWLVGAGSRLKSGDTSFLPMLADRVVGSLFLLDASDGAVGLGLQLRELLSITQTTQLVIVDTGGDILARGLEPGLRSPLADALILAAARISGAPMTVAVLGLGLDGELTPEECEAAIARATLPDRTAMTLRITPVHAGRVRGVFSWSPSEVAGLAWLAAHGYRGKAEIRAGGIAVELTDDSANVHLLHGESVFGQNLLAAALCSTRSLAEADDEVAMLGSRSELDVERQAAIRWRIRPDGQRLRGDWLARLEAYSENVASRGISYLTLRRVAEVLGIDDRDARRLAQILGRRDPMRINPPVWLTRSSWMRRGRQQAEPVWRWPKRLDQ